MAWSVWLWFWPTPVSYTHLLQEAAYEQMQAEASQVTASAQLPEAQEQALDEYPMPDEQVSTPDMQEYGYSYDGMLPVCLLYTSSVTFAQIIISAISLSISTMGEIKYAFSIC